MSRLGPCRGAWCSAGGVGSRPFGSRAGSGPGTSQLGCRHAGRAPCARTALSVRAFATVVVPPEGGDGSGRSSHQTRVEPRSCQAPHVLQSSSTTNNPRPPGVSGSGGSMPGLRREPGSVTAIRTRSSSIVTSTVSARRGPPSGSRATRFAPSAWPTIPPSCDHAICSWRGPSPHDAIVRRGCPLPAGCWYSATSEFRMRATPASSRRMLRESASRLAGCFAQDWVQAGWERRLRAQAHH